MKKIITFIIFFFLTLNFQTSAEEPITMNMVFVPASEKGDDKDYINLIKIRNIPVDGRTLHISHARKCRALPGL